MTSMPDPAIFLMTETLPPLRRPGLLIRAARAGQAGWRRSRDLPRLLRNDHCPGHARAAYLLRQEEALLNDARLKGEASYDVKRHVLVLIALLAEINALARLGAQIAAPSGRGRSVPERP
jgi:hypothetical protein